MNAATLPLVLFVLLGVAALVCEGRIGGETERCLCPKTNLQKTVVLARVQALQVFAPSASCSNTEIIVTLNTGGKVCLDPKGRQGRRFLSAQRRQKKVKTQGGKKQKGKMKQQFKANHR